MTIYDKGGRETERETDRQTSDGKTKENQMTLRKTTMGVQSVGAIYAHLIALY